LAIIAYKQPVTKHVIETIRGVNADYTVQKLVEKELIEIAGRSEEPGKPLLYKTTQQFLDYFGINSLDDLPKLKEFEELQNQIGEKENIENNHQSVDDGCGKDAGRNLQQANRKNPRRNSCRSKEVQQIGR